MRRLFLTAGISGILGLALPATPGAGASTPHKLPSQVTRLLGETGELDTKVVAKLTGADSLNHTEQWDVYGTDLGHMFLYDGQLRFTFGDTFGEGRPDVGPGGTNHRDNTMARSTDTNPVDGLTFDGYVTIDPTDPFSDAKKLFDDDTVASVIPTYGIAVGKRMFLHYMAVRSWGDPGYWDVAYSGLAYSDDGGQTWANNEGNTWTKDPKVRWEDDSNFAQVAMLHGSSGPLPPKDVPYVYLVGIPEGRFGGLLSANDPAKPTGVQLARVLEGKLLDPLAYEYWNGLTWVSGEGNAVTVVDAPVGELSVRWSGHYNRWLMTYLNDDNEAGEPERIVLRSAADLTGTWSDELVLTTSAQYRQPYAPYQVPTQPDGPHLYYNMSRFDKYNVFLMRTTLPDSLP